MGAGDRSYTRGVRAALILFGKGKCYWPACPAALLGFADGEHKITLEIAHIRAAKPDGPRYVKEMTPAQRKAFDNLIFLCKLHHATVDGPGAEERYPIETLQEWKEQREQGEIENLRGLQEVTEGKLVELISEATIQRDQELKNTLARLERTDEEAAALLRELRNELQAVQRNSSLIDVDAAAMLDRAASTLYHMSLPDYASMLVEAGKDLGGLEDGATRLMAAVQSLNGIESQASKLMQAANELNRAVSRAEDLGGRWG